ncbi:MOSC domain-containing protein YiiM [Streptomyces sp. SAI-208]|jgi:MOSC domain-containing protein YiiM|uniref:MOSC domain-containing protein n=1 Tax=unclassified Streptomyces TaxID=2593676 RepID=UPI002474F041|nr:MULTISPECIES: MOSC domain-containing protein [unclassified Streptomyces]MDH6516370.1 MOSC domain-containing protein YiiM [Streptomyces sp. SAI-090]MDH6548564.1 MOSC domain-containing protein YiiM [Streptomyces sp. SAI-041]MDH6567658.1 MOSC domain-containing protein YiiM [Streptomyces sp. SAI-117]MDH6587413.1 MOSC domain-containing protein YiiM [Streptomyces sp. SAI-133]MDH6607174.1 MOSC domain-containing protein YiiM [Streptomyces sp. SAI-208]
MGGKITAVSSNGTYSFTKPNREAITLLAGFGVAGDVHGGATVKHRFRMRKDPSQPNLRQVHLMHAELFEELRAAGFEVGAGELGENVTTRGVDLLGLSVGTRLHLGDEAVVEVTGLRNPCAQIDRFRKGLLKEVVGRGPDGAARFRSGIMSVVVVGGVVRPGDTVGVEAPPGPHRPLDIV